MRKKRSWNKDYYLTIQISIYARESDIWIVKQQSLYRYVS